LLIQGDEADKDALMQVARLMCLAARTAPKGGGVDGIVTAILISEQKDAVANEMRRIGLEQGMHAYVLNAQDVEDAGLVVVIGTKLRRYRIKTCDFCGFADCNQNAEANGICAIAVGDLGIAIGSAVEVAGRLHADNRIMFTVGKAVLSLRLLEEEVKICYGIPLSAKGKNPFFDKDWKKAYGVEGWRVK